MGQPIRQYEGARLVTRCDVLCGGAPVAGAPPPVSRGPWWFPGCRRRGQGRSCVGSPTDIMDTMDIAGNSKLGDVTASRDATVMDLIGVLCYRNARLSVTVTTAV